MLKPRGPVCNLDCQYCYYLSKERLYPESDFRMSEELLDAFTRQYIESQKVPEVIFTWQGGEPLLMGLDFFRQAVDLQKEYGIPGMAVFNTLQTNGILLNEEWCRFFRDNGFLIGISLDGPREYHDVLRVDRSGRPTFEQVMAGVELLKRNGVEFNILTCVHSANGDHPLEVYRFLRDEVGAQFIQFIPVVERDNDTGFQEGNQVTERSATGRQYGDFLIAVFDEWVRNDVGRVFVQIFDVALAGWSGERVGLCLFEERCGTALVMEHNGDIYSCDHFVEPRYLLGNFGDKTLGEIVNSGMQRRFGADKRDKLPKYCTDCDVRFICNGGCPRNRFAGTPDAEGRLNFLCEGYRAFFDHIDRPMKFMERELRAGRPPANIMSHVDSV